MSREKLKILQIFVRRFTKNDFQKRSISARKVVFQTAWKTCPVVLIINPYQKCLFHQAKFRRCVGEKGRCDGSPSTPSPDLLPIIPHSERDLTNLNEIKRRCKRAGGYVGFFVIVISPPAVSVKGYLGQFIIPPAVLGILDGPHGHPVAFRIIHNKRLGVNPAVQVVRVKVSAKPDVVGLLKTGGQMIVIPTLDVSPVHLG